MGNGLKLITGPQPVVVSKETKEMREKADEVFIQAVDALEGALNLKQEIEAMQDRDIIAETLLAVKEPRGRHHHDDRQ